MTLTNTFIVGITGKKYSGKDTFAQLLQAELRKINPNLYILIDSFANPLKEILIEHCGFTHADLHDPVKKQEMNDFWGFTNRAAAQKLGTECMRDNFHPDVWVKIMELRMKKLAPQILIIPDVRFDNEAKFVSESGGFMIKINRGEDHTAELNNDGGIEGHRSEQGVDPIYINELVDNNYELTFLRSVAASMAVAVLGEMTRQNETPLKATLTATFGAKV